MLTSTNVELILEMSKIKTKISLYSELCSLFSVLLPSMSVLKLEFNMDTILMLMETTEIVKLV